MIAYIGSSNQPDIQVKRSLLAIALFIVAVSCDKKPAEKKIALHSSALNLEALADRIIAQSKPQKGEKVFMIGAPNEFDSLIIFLKDKFAASGALRTEVSFAATGGLRQTAFAPSGQWAATVVGEPGAEAGGPGTQRMLAWPLPPQRLQSAACDAVARNLSASEWQRYALPGPWRETCPGKPQTAE